VSNANLRNRFLKDSGADFIGHGGTCPPLLQTAGHGGTVSRRTANKKLTKLYWPSQKCSPKRLYCTFRAKKWKGTTKKNFPALCAGSGPPLSNSFRRPYSKMTFDENNVTQHFCSVILKSLDLRHVNDDSNTN